MQERMISYFRMNKSHTTSLFGRLSIDDIVFQIFLVLFS